jgi:hypothetical protein
MGLKKLPIDDPDFRAIIPGNYLYADKTKYIYNLITNYRFCFLSRPRRFGKTLLLDTIGELFSGDRELFKGLWIGRKKNFKFESHPVFRLSMAYANLSSPEDLADRIEDSLKLLASREQIALTGKSYGEMLGELLYGVQNKYGAGAVILIDEYDAPVSGYISNEEFASKNAKVLHDFYTSMKTYKSYVRFALITGITRFAFASMDSGPNNFKDISLMSEYSGICGFTETEFGRLFKGWMKKILPCLKEAEEIEQDSDTVKLTKTILDWYDGYSWLGKERVLNPYSILNLFSDEKLGVYWPLSGQPSHLSQLAKKRPLDFIQPKLDSYLSRQLKTAVLKQISPASILFHSGYLTIDKSTRVEIEFEGKKVKEEAFILKIPNQEVGVCYKSFMFTQIFDQTFDEFKAFSEDLTSALLNEDSDKISLLFHNLLTGITSRQHTPDEKYYHSLFHAAFVGAGIEVLSETGGSWGQADMALFLDGKIRVVIEVKYRKGTGSVVKEELNPAELKRSDREIVSALDDAENAIRTKDYQGPFRVNSRKIICLALAVRGRDEVAARFLDSAATLSTPAP